MTNPFMCFYVTFGSVKSLNNSIVCFMRIIKEKASVNCLILLRLLANIYWLLRIAAGREGQKNEKKNENIPVILSYEAPWATTARKSRPLCSKDLKKARKQRKKVQTRTRSSEHTISGVYNIDMKKKKSLIQLTIKEFTVSEFRVVATNTVCHRRRR